MYKINTTKTKIKQLKNNNEEPSRSFQGYQIPRHHPVCFFVSSYCVCYIIISIIITRIIIIVDNYTIHDDDVMMVTINQNHNNKQPLFPSTSRVPSFPNFNFLKFVSLQLSQARAHPEEKRTQSSQAPYCPHSPIPFHIIPPFSFLLGQLAYLSVPLFSALLCSAFHFISVQPQIKLSSLFPPSTSAPLLLNSLAAPNIK